MSAATESSSSPGKRRVSSAPGRSRPIAAKRDPRAVHPLERLRVPGRAGEHERPVVLRLREVHVDVRPVAGLRRVGRPPGHLAQHERRLLRARRPLGGCEHPRAHRPGEQVGQGRQPVGGCREQVGVRRRRRARRRRVEPRCGRRAEQLLEHRVEHGEGRPEGAAGDPGCLDARAEGHHDVGEPPELGVGAVRHRDESTRAAVPLDRAQHLGAPAGGRHRDDREVGRGGRQERRARELDDDVRADGAVAARHDVGGVPARPHAEHEHPRGAERRQSLEAGDAGVEGVGELGERRGDQLEVGAKGGGVHGSSGWSFDEACRCVIAASGA